MPCRNPSSQAAFGQQDQPATVGQNDVVTWGLMFSQVYCFMLATSISLSK